MGIISYHLLLENKLVNIDKVLKWYLPDRRVHSVLAITLAVANQCTQQLGKKSERRSSKTR